MQGIPLASVMLKWCEGVVQTMEAGLHRREDRGSASRPNREHDKLWIPMHVENVLLSLFMRVHLDQHLGPALIFQIGVKKRGHRQKHPSISSEGVASTTAHLYNFPQ